MSPADLDVARELAARPRWGWRAGMRVVIGGRPRSPWRLYTVSDGDSSWLAATGDGAAGGFVGSWTTYEEASRAYSAYVPDLDDPATAGVLLAMLHESVSSDLAIRLGHGGEYSAHVRLCCDLAGHRGITLGAAVARCLLSVWGAA